MVINELMQDPQTSGATQTLLDETFKAQESYGRDLAELSAFSAEVKQKLASIIEQVEDIKERILAKIWTQPDLFVDRKTKFIEALHFDGVALTELMDTQVNAIRDRIKRSRQQVTAQEKRIAKIEQSKSNSVSFSIP